VSSQSNILSKKLDIIQWVSGVEDIEIIEKIIKLRKEESDDWWESISENEKASIQAGIEDADSKKLQPHVTAKKLYEKWL
jgi:hypothetical protein